MGEIMHILQYFHSLPCSTAKKEHIARSDTYIILTAQHFFN